MYPKNEILDWINDEKSQIVSFLQDFIRAKSPNPPGDTVNASKVIRSLLKKHNAPIRVVAPQKSMPNLIGTIEGANARRWNAPIR